MFPAVPLLLQTEFFDDCVVFTLVVRLEVAQVATAVGNHLQEAPTRVVILVVLLQMAGQLTDFTGEHSNLHLRRTGISVMASRIFNDGRLYALGQHVAG